MIDPVQAIPAVAPSATNLDTSGSAAPTAVSVAASVPKAPEPTSGATAAQTAQTAQAAQTASAASDSQSSADAGPPLRLLIEHDKATNQYVYKLYDSSGRIVREIPQESLADAQKQASGVPGALFDTTV
jgi:uncharacterized FlaG/YvyC family protein